jgi:hypothetical protein
VSLDTIDSDSNFIIDFWSSSRGQYVQVKPTQTAPIYRDRDIISELSKSGINRLALQLLYIYSDA